MCPSGTNFIKECAIDPDYPYPSPCESTKGHTIKFAGKDGSDPEDMALEFVNDVTKDETTDNSTTMLYLTDQKQTIGADDSFNKLQVFVLVDPSAAYVFAGFDKDNEQYFNSAITNFEKGSQDIMVVKQQRHIVINATDKDAEGVLTNNFRFTFNNKSAKQFFHNCTQEKDATVISKIKKTVDINYGQIPNR